MSFGVPTKLLALRWEAWTCLDSKGNTYDVVVMNTGFEVRQVRIQILILPLTTCVTLDELLK